MRAVKINLYFAIILLITFQLIADSAYCRDGGTSSMYEIAKCSRWVSGHKWRYILVDESATKRDIQTIYNDLRAKYPNDYFELFNEEDTLVAMYKHSQKRSKFPDTKGHLGMINQMGYDYEWKFTTMSGYKLLKE